MEVAGPVCLTAAGPAKPRHAMIGISSNSKAVAAAFAQLQREFPQQMGQVLSTVGMSMRKDIRNAFRGKGPVPVARLNPLTLKMRRAGGNRSRTMGGKLPNTIKYAKQGTKSVTVGTTAEEVGRAFQTDEQREFDKYEKRIIAKANNPDLVGETNRFRLRYYADKVTETLNRPARPIFEPYANWPGLRTRIVEAGQKAIRRMAERAAAKAKSAGAVA